MIPHSSRVHNISGKAGVDVHTRGRRRGWPKCDIVWRDTAALDCGNGNIVPPNNGQGAGSLDGVEWARGAGTAAAEVDRRVEDVVAVEVKHS